MKVLIIGGVAAGTKTAAKLKREHREYEVTILTKGEDISYAGCGLPYYVGDVIHEKSELIVNTPESFAGLTGVDVKTRTEVTKLNREAKTVLAKDLATGEEKEYAYDKLVIAVGADPVKPPLPGLDLEGVYFMRTPTDAIVLREAIEAGKVKRVVIVGGGFIGLEVAENLQAQGAKVSIIDMAPQVLPGFDPEVAEYVENYLADRGIMAFTNTKLAGVEGENGHVTKVLTEKRGMKADTVILSMGIRPNTAFLADSGLEMFKGTLAVDEHLQTNDPDIYAVGDCAFTCNRQTGKKAWSPLGSSANMEGRVAARVISGDDVSYTGVFGTSVAQLPGLNVGRTGLTETAAKEMGIEAESAVLITDDKAHYFPGASTFIIKLIAEKGTKKLLGVQVVGAGAVDKVVDICVMAIAMKATLQDMENLDFAYAPPFSTAIHPLVNAVNVLLNKMEGRLVSITPAQYKAGAAEGYKVMDVSLSPSVDGAPYVDLTKIEGEVPGFAKDDKILVVCNKGKRAYLTQNRLKFYGYTNTVVLEGGTIFTEVKA
ncbi:FAD-dependent oxidoreductase [Cuneatibacter sp. NSJ-177]|jgi:NADPH-dependent 2,4-dienoyl-CoA reductase/sulfur reductase-like enzyme/rhodanese-related sulfurtransferase|uniref:FAD-dependent oxidoreductase n=1 Tax=Cuneatibacter sp. NSJ-177 TaxID=2931401 RepID=UPI001FD46F4E|nr:FAD-dependent oxidoreductase [Cuneatibacter sp. NSJ-177]MCJ7835521.1 FAD-dependent oxidoreductase [Cuneatibacter sp. NSJ-177]